jgi:putative ABC transport system ATP-binding protein
MAYNYLMADTTADNLIFRLENVSYISGGNDVLRDIDLGFEKDRITLVTGPSGSGKTTLLKILGMLISPTSGKIFYKGKSLDDYDPSQFRSRTILVGQKPYLIEGTVMDNLNLPFTLRSNRDKKPAEDIFRQYLNRLDLNGDFMLKQSKKISGGEAQRMALVRALTLEPETLLLDEPTSALDISSEEKVVNLLREYKGRKTIVVVTHSPTFLELSDRAVILKQGRTAKCSQTLTPKELKDCLEGRI